MMWGACAAHVMLRQVMPCHVTSCDGMGWDVIRQVSGVMLHVACCMCDV